MAVLRGSGTFIMPKGKFQQSLCEKKKQGFNCAVLQWLSAQGKFQRSLCDKKKQGANWRCYVLVEVSSCRRGNSNNLWAKKQGFNCAVLNWLSARRNSSNLFVKKTSIQLRCFTLVKCPLEFPGISLRQKKQGANWWCYVLVELSSCRRGNSNNLWARRKNKASTALF